MTGLKFCNQCVSSLKQGELRIKSNLFAETARAEQRRVGGMQVLACINR